MRIFILCSILFSIQVVANAAPRLHPVKLSPTTLEGLLQWDPTMEGFHAVPFWESIEANSAGRTPELFFKDEGVLIAEQLFQRFCTNPMLSAPAIPSIIHMIWMGSAPTLLVNLAIASWQKHHPGWEFRLWTDKEVKELRWSHPRSEFLFGQARNWAEKSDILRFEILYQYGGIYADTDVMCLKSLDALAKSGIGFFAGFEANKIQVFKRPLIGSAVLGSAKNHPILHRCIEYTFTKQERPRFEQYVRSGPGPISKACYEALETNQQDVLILPCSSFHPLPWTKRWCCLEQILEMIRPESFAMHLWEGTWLEDE